MTSLAEPTPSGSSNNSTNNWRWQPAASAGSTQQLSHQLPFSSQSGKSLASTTRGGEETRARIQLHQPSAEAVRSCSNSYWRCSTSTTALVRPGNNNNNVLGYSSATTVLVSTSNNNNCSNYNPATTAQLRPGNNNNFASYNSRSTAVPRAGVVTNNNSAL